MKGVLLGLAVAIAIYLLSFGVGKATYTEPGEKERQCSRVEVTAYTSTTVCQ